MSSPLRVVLLCLALAATAFQCNQSRGDSMSHLLATQRYEDVYYLPPPAWLRVLSLGHHEALAGLVWLKGLVYFGEEVANRGRVKHLVEYAEAMLALDPRFKRAYRWIATNSVYRLGRIQRSDVERAIAYLERGARVFPDDGDLAWDLAAFYLYEYLPHLKGEERSAMRRTGMEHLRVAILRRTGPPWLVLNAASELEELGHIEQQVAYLQDAYAQVSDPKTREEIARRIGQLQSRSFAEAMRRSEEQLEAERVHSFAYLDRELFIQVGKKPAFDGRALLLRGFDPEPDEEQAQDQAEGQTEPPSP